MIGSKYRVCPSRDGSLWFRARLWHFWNHDGPYFVGIEDSKKSRNATLGRKMPFLSGHQTKLSIVTVVDAVALGFVAEFAYSCFEHIGCKGDITAGVFEGFHQHFALKVFDGFLKGEVGQGV